MFNLKQLKEFLFEQKELLTNSLVILVCLVLFLKLPAANSFQEICKEIFFLAVVPIFYIKMVLKKSLKEFGFSLPRERSDFFWAAGVLLLSWIVFFLLFKFTDFGTNYHISRSIRNNFGAFLFYEFVTFNFLFWLQEVFFKGFVLFSFSPRLKLWSILITTSIYCAALFVERAFIWQMAPLIFYSFFGGLLAFKSKSLWLAYATGLIFVISFESFLIFISK